MPIDRLKDFLRLESAAGILLMAAALLAIFVDNSPLASLYTLLLDLEFSVALGTAELAKPLLLWINDGLMAVFFLLVGLEVKREILVGHLAKREALLLPLLAALGGMAVPALIYLSLAAGDPVAAQGWAIPAATDIAFALGIMALLGSRVPVSLKVLLTAIAIIDDLGAILIIAFFYTADLSLVSLGLAALSLATLLALNLARVTRIAPYMLVGAILWVCVLKSGVHATLAGVAVGLFVPLKGKDGTTPLEDLEHALHPWVAYMILPLFAFANAGLPLHALELSDLAGPVPLGVALGLFLGKQIGVFGGAALLIRSGLVPMPEGAGWRSLYGTAALTGVGFTMSLFIGSLAFDSAETLNAVRLGVLVGSLASGALGYVLLMRGNGTQSVK
ncbi:MAG: Na+/H+ antiporter NhaA [Rhodothalassiaceae bacterium]